MAHQWESVKSWKKVFKFSEAAPKVTRCRTSIGSVTRKVSKTQIQADTNILDWDKFSMMTSEIQWNIHKSASRCQIQTVVGWSSEKCLRVKNLPDTKNSGFHEIGRSISKFEWNLEKVTQIPMARQLVGQWLGKCPRSKKLTDTKNAGFCRFRGSVIQKMPDP